VATRFFLAGEASHGTHDFYRRRAELTKRLIAEPGFTAVTVEGDWPDAYRVDRFARGLSEDGDAEEALRVLPSLPVLDVAQHGRAGVPDLAAAVERLPSRRAPKTGFKASLGEQFDAVIHLDETSALEPLERTSEWERGELPETYPWGV
jgi:erythromycin esterase-like protein